MFQQRLNELLKINNMFKSDLGKNIGYTPQAVSKWCRGENEPDFKTLVMIANFFNVSTDYLLGNDSKTTKDFSIKNIEQESLKKALQKAGYMKSTEDLTDEELDKLMKFVVNNKDFLKGNK